MEAEIATIRRQLDAVLSGQRILARGQERLEQLMANGAHDVAPFSARSEFSIIGPRVSTACLPQPMSDLSPLTISRPSIDVDGATHFEIGPASVQLTEVDGVEFLEVESHLRENGSPISRASTMSHSMAAQVRQVYLRRKARLRDLLSINEEVQIQKMARQGSIDGRQIKRGTIIGALHAGDSPEVLESRVDACMSVLILVNTVVIGLSIDHAVGKWSVWQFLDVSFACIYLCEFFFKIVLHGVRGYFCGEDSWSNIFDSTIVGLDVIQVILGIISTTGQGTRVASLFRIVRLFRLFRIFRLVRLKALQGLLEMVQGFSGGALTLAWAIVLFLSLIYLFAVFCRASLGRRSEDHLGLMYPYFNSVPRSMLTIFRCSFGDCNSEDGVSIPEHITIHYGGWYALAYCSFVFFITIGLFNIISAIFVESTMSAARKKEAKRMKTRLQDPNRWAESTVVIIKELLGTSPDHAALTDSLLVNIDKIVDIEFTRDVIDAAVKDKLVKEALGDLDIEKTDHKRLSDILDPDHSGTIGMLELVEGLRRLRGVPQRSDVVSIDLMVRSLQEKVEHTLELVMKLNAKK